MFFTDEKYSLTRTTILALLPLLYILFFVFSPFSDIYLCMDDLTDKERLDWHNKTITIKSNVDYWSDQILAHNYMLEDLENDKDKMDNDTYLKKKAEIEEDNRLNIRNLNSEKRMLSVLEKRGLVSESSVTYSTSAKREASDIAESSSKKK